MNIISRECRFQWDLRNIPEDDPQEYLDRFEAKCDELRAEMKSVNDQADIETTSDYYAPGLTSTERVADAVAVAGMRAAWGNRRRAVVLARIPGRAAGFARGSATKGPAPGASAAPPPPGNCPTETPGSRYEARISARIKATWRMAGSLSGPA